MFIKYLIGQNFVGQNFRHQAQISTVLFDEFLSDKVLPNSFISAFQKYSWYSSTNQNPELVMKQSWTESTWFVNIVYLSRTIGHWIYWQYILELLILVVIWNHSICMSLTKSNCLTTFHFSFLPPLAKHQIMKHLSRHWVELWCEI